VAGSSSALLTPGKKARPFFFFAEMVHGVGLTSFAGWARSGLRWPARYAPLSLSLFYLFFLFSDLKFAI
jgi:hypothetical protein